MGSRVPGSLVVAAGALLLGCLILLALRGGSPAGTQVATPSVETVIRGVEARADGLTFRGRFVEAQLDNKTIVECQKVFEPDPTQVVRPTGGFTDGVLELSILDVACDGARSKWRYEKRAASLSGMPLTEWKITRPPPYTPQQLYRYSVCDGETVRDYYRSCTTLYLHPFEGRHEGLDRVDQVRWEALQTKSYRVPFSLTFGDAERVAVRYRGVQTLDNIECQVWACDGPHEPPKGYFRMWVAPQLDFAIVRDEQVEVGADGKPIHCIVIRRSGWDIAEGVALHTPRKVQLDYHDLERVSADGGREWVWTSSRLLVVDKLELSGKPLPDEALDVSVPFDTNVYDAGQEMYLQWDPTTSRHPLDLAQFLPPDELGERLRTESPESVMLGE